MIYIFTWNSQYLILEALIEWRNQFISKYWDFNVLHIKDLKDITIDFLALNFFSSSFLNEKKLIIIDLDNELNEELSNFFINSLDKIPENNILIFHFPTPDKRQKLYKEIEKKATKKEFNLNDESQTYNYINKKYKETISPSAINTIIRYKWNNLNKIISEIEKLRINNEKIDDKLIIENIFPELEESIFQIIDDILNLNITKAIEKIQSLINEVNIFAFYNSLIINIRNQVFISKLKNENKNSKEISEILNLWNKSFLANKNFKINYQKLKDLYIDLVNLDKKIKTWKTIWTEEKDILQEIEIILLKTYK